MIQSPVSGQVAPSDPDSAQKLSVLVVHNRYQQRGGEDSVFEAETELLESRGHRVGRLLFDNRDLPESPGVVQSLTMGLQTVWSGSARARLRGVLREFKPDIVHFHNTFPQISPAAYAVCHEAGAAVVQTLHNYRLVCVNGSLYRDGRPCEDCIGHRLTAPAVVHACYRDSRAQSAAATAMLAFHNARGTWRRDVDLYISPSQFLRRKLIQGGLPADRISVKPNFVTPDPGAKSGDGAYALFVGRLAQNKGIETLLEAYRSRADLPPLHVVGDGELAGAVAFAAAMDPRIVNRGRLEREGVLPEMGGASCLAFPSLWYENFPVTIAEAYARGLPVIGSRLGATAELVADGRTGLLFRAGDAADLAEKLAWTHTHPDELRVMGATARQEYETRYNPDRNYETLLGLYMLAQSRLRAEMKA